MTFEKALEAMKQGKKVTVSYDKHKYFCINTSGEDFGIVDETGDWADITLNEALTLDWEIYEEPHEEPETAAEKAKSILRAVRAEAICHGMVFEHCSLEKFVAAIDFALEILKKQAEKEKKVSQLDENAQKKQEAANKCGFNCKIQPAKFFPDDIPTIAFDMFAAGLKLGLEIAKDLQKENKNNA